MNSNFTALARLLSRLILLSQSTYSLSLKAHFVQHAILPADEFKHLFHNLVELRNLVREIAIYKDKLDKIIDKDFSDIINKNGSAGLELADILNAQSLVLLTSLPLYFSYSSEYSPIQLSSMCSFSWYSRTQSKLIESASQVCKLLQLYPVTTEQLSVPAELVLHAGLESDSYEDIAFVRHSIKLPTLELKNLLRYKNFLLQAEISSPDMIYIGWNINGSAKACGEVQLDHQRIIVCAKLLKGDFLPDLTQGASITLELNLDNYDKNLFNAMILIHRLEFFALPS